MVTNVEWFVQVLVFQPDPFITCPEATDLQLGALGPVGLVKQVVGRQTPPEVFIKARLALLLFERVNLNDIVLAAVTISADAPRMSFPYFIN